MRWPVLRLRFNLRSSPGFSFETVGWAHSWETRPLREVIKAQGATEQEDNRPDLEHIRDLALNILLLLTYYQSDSVMVEGPLRNLKMRGKHLRPELSRARFLSELLEKRVYRKATPREATEETVSTSGSDDTHHTGITRRQHWTRGHWREIRYGKGLSQWRLGWIMAYRTYGPE